MSARRGRGALPLLEDTSPAVPGGAAATRARCSRSSRGAGLTSGSALLVGGVRGELAGTALLRATRVFVSPFCR